ncbi:MAG: 3-dehydroquinate synthase [Rickettsiales bacterium]|jgi:3-dehydroquinate synthase|nr:3-dehydroquinate synthase [Rickettsiales bacterium]
MKKVSVKLSTNGYDILIGSGLLRESAELINGVFPINKCKKAFVIADENIRTFGYLETLNDNLKRVGYEYMNIVIPPGEKSKSFRVFERTAEFILQNGLSRSDFLVALGGGVVGDLVGFLASVLLRGIQFLQIPTTLLAQVDSSVGGKTGINSNSGKNLMGTFHQPRLVIIDPLTLETLPPRDLRAGYTEALKYSLVMDRDFFHYLEKNGKRCIDLDPDVCDYVIQKSCQSKAYIVEQDEYETKDIRVILNLGHTFGHVYEKIANFDERKIRHGEAVGIGILQAFQLGSKIGIGDEGELNLLLGHFDKLGLFNFDDLGKIGDFRDVSHEVFMNLMKKDKKSECGKINLVLCEKIGVARLFRGIPEEKIINSFF